MTAYRAQLYRKSISAVALLEGSLLKIILGWVALITVGGIQRISFAVSPINSRISLPQMGMPYLIISERANLTYRGRVALKPVQ